MGRWKDGSVGCVWKTGEMDHEAEVGEMGAWKPGGMFGAMGGWVRAGGEWMGRHRELVFSL